MSEWRPIAESHRNDGDEIVVRLKNGHPRMPVELLGKSVHQIGIWLEGDLLVGGCKLEDALVEGVMFLPRRKS